MDEQPKIYTDQELRYAATARCRCGAGLAYPKDAPIDGCWTCSFILKTAIKVKINRESDHAINAPDLQDENGVFHDGQYPFAYCEIKSEDQPSAEGQTTRP